MPFKRSRENKLAIATNVLVFVAFFSAMLGKLDPTTFKGYDADVIGALLVTLGSCVIFGSICIGLASSASELEDSATTASWHWLLALLRMCGLRADEVSGSTLISYL